MGAAAIKNNKKIREYFRFTHNELRILVIFSLIFLTLLAFQGYEDWRWTHRTIPPDVLAFEKMYLKAVRDVKLQSASGIKKDVSAIIHIDLNRATRKELIQLPGVGPKTAERILIYRRNHGPFKNKRDLLKVRGIGIKKFKAIEPFLK